MMHTRFALAGLLVSSAAQASTFDETTGKLSSADAAIAFGFEEAPPNGLTLLQFNSSFQPLSLKELMELRRSDALEGDFARAMGGTSTPVLVGIMEGLRERLSDRRVEIKIWQRAQGTRLRTFLIWFSGDVEAALSIPSFASLVDVGVLPFLPTGRATDDGWLELTSGPVDFLLARKLAPVLYIDDERMFDPPPYTFSGEGRAWLDALEIHDLGPAEVPDTSCNLGNEDQSCGAMGLCRMGRCADRSVIDGPSFPNAQLQEEYLTRRIFERRTFSGHRLARGQLDSFDERVEQAPPKRFWTTINRATDLLGDGHSSAAQINPVSPLTSGVCLQEAEVDLLPGQTRLPMVFRSNTAHPVGAAVQVGDVLLEVDGMPLSDWRTLAAPLLRYNADPDGRDLVTTPQLLLVAMSKGASLTFTRCVASPDNPQERCATERRIEIDTATHTEALWNAQPPAWLSASTVCEPRFLRTVEAPDIAQSTHVGTRDADGIRYLQINATPGPVDAPSIQWFSKVANAFDPPPSLMMLDERRGDGGGFQGVQWLTRFFFELGTYPAALLVPWLDTYEDDLELKSAMVQCTLNDRMSGYFTCGGMFIADDVFLPQAHPAPAVAQETKLAVLTGQDGSGNDYLTHHLRQRSQGSTRVFGPVQLFGAYGEIGGLPTYGVGFSGGSLQLNDSAILDSAKAPIDVLVSGRGVTPDVIVYQKQSDALQGVDTIIEAARAWLLEE